MERARIYKTTGRVEGIHSTQTLVYIVRENQRIGLISENTSFKILPEFLLDSVYSNLLKYEIQFSEVDGKLVDYIFERVKRGKSWIDIETVKSLCSLNSK